MRFVDSPYPSGTVVVATDHLGRYNDFEICLERLKVPHGTVLLRPKSGSCAFNCNNGVRNRRGSWLWFMDDDQLFESDVLLRLLAHDKDIVSALVPMRYPPFDLVLYKELEFKEHAAGVSFKSDFYRIHEIGEKTGLMKVAGLPKASMLVKNHVWEKMPEPWFKIGRIRPDEIDDDRLFMWEVRSHGFELWADLDQFVPHLTTIGIGLRRTNGQLQLCGHMQGRVVGIER